MKANSFFFRKCKTKTNSLFENGNARSVAIFSRTNGNFEPTSLLGLHFGVWNEMGFRLFGNDHRVHSVAWTV